MKASEKILVHVGVGPGLQRKLEDGGEKAVSACAKELGLSAVNAERLRLFGIITGQVHKDAVDALRKREGVSFVETDKVQKAI